MSLSDADRNACRDDADSLLRLAASIRALDAPPPDGLGDWEAGTASLRDSPDADALRAERRLDAAARRLRLLWLRRAHVPGERLMKAPLEGEEARLPDGEPLSYGYERELDVSALERRGEAFVEPPAGRAGACVVFSSAQAALTAILLLLQSRVRVGGPLRVAHFGAYFETVDLLALLAGRALQLAPPGGRRPADVHVVEAVSWDGRFAASDLEAAARAEHAVVFDATATGPDRAPLQALAGGGRAPLFRVASGLKLDQAGLELSSVGVVHVFAEQPQDIADDLRRIRALSGGGLTVDQYSALCAPWFLDRAEAEAHAGAIFDANARLARAIGREPALFAPRCHPAVLDPPSRFPAPFCALQLRDPSPEAYRRLVACVETAAQARGLALDRGGSFGFRGHRFELVEPEGKPEATFLRVAMGRRGGRSARLLVDLIAELAAAPSLDAAARAVGSPP